MSGCRKLTHVEMSNSITEIGSWAFANSGITEIVIPNSVTKIDYHAFAGCNKLTRVFFNAEICTYANQAFANCNGLKQVVFGEEVMQIPKMMLQGSSIEEVTIPESVTKIGTSAFSGCSNLTTLNYNVEDCDVGDSVFFECDAINKVEFGNTVKRIPNDFLSNTAITEITIPESVTRIGDMAFAFCRNLTSVNFNATNCRTSNNLSDIYGFFWGCNALNEVTFGENVTMIPDKLFNGCSSLTHITLPKSLTRIGANSFSGTGMEELTIPESVSFIGDAAFKSCSNLTTVLFNARECVVPMQSYAFMNCESLTKAVIGENVKLIPQNIFTGCHKLNDIFISDSVTQIGGESFKGTALEKVIIPNSVTMIGFGAFSDCNDLTSLTLGNSVSLIDSKAFVNCPIVSITSNREAPPSVVVVEEVFDSNVYSNASLFVPKGSVERYQRSNVWKQFKNIFEIDNNVPEEWGKWSTVGTATTTTNLTGMFATLQSWGSTENTPWEEPIIIEQRVCLTDSKKIQLRLNDIFNSKDIILNYDTQTTLISSEIQNTGYATNSSLLENQGITDYFDEFMFSAGEGYYFPATGVLDLSNAFFYVNNSLGFKLGFSLQIQDITPPTFTATWSRNYVPRTGIDSVELVVEFEEPIVKYRKILISPGESLKTSELLSLYSAHPNTNLEYEETFEKSFFVTCSKIGKYSVILIPLGADGVAVSKYQMYYIASYVEPKYSSYTWEYVGKSTVTEHIGSLLIPYEYMWEEVDGERVSKYPWRATTDSVETYRRADNPNIIGLRNLFNENHSYSSLFNYVDQTQDWWIYIDITDPNNVKLYTTPVGVISSEVGYNTFINQFTNYGPATHSNGVISFPFGTVLLNGIINQDFNSNFDMQIVLPSDIESAISDVKSGKGQTEYFNLNGQRLTRPEGGVYIKRHNGKVSKHI